MKKNNFAEYKEITISLIMICREKDFFIVSFITIHK
jgi:hypothetical protein